MALGLSTRKAKLRSALAGLSLSVATWLGAHSSAVGQDPPDVFAPTPHELTSPSPSDRYGVTEEETGLRRAAGSAKGRSARVTETDDSITPLTEAQLERIRLSHETSLVDSTELLNAYELEAALAPPLTPPKNPAASAYKGLFYDNDFRYLNQPNQHRHYLGDNLKQIEVGDRLVVDAGGEYRLRHHNEAGLRGSNLTGKSDIFLLERTRLFLNARYGEWLRFYGEAVDANSHWENLPPRSIEENRWDALNLFSDVLLTGDTDTHLWLRGGRQELLYGDERLISPLDWSNTRRTFDGLKLFYQSPDWNIDAFWTRPISFSQHGTPTDHEFDRPNQKQEFYGIYSTYKGRPDNTHDFYYLGYADYGALAPAPNLVTQLFGSRWKAKHGHWLTDLEGGYQFGSKGTLDVSAGFVTAGLGREFAHTLWTPTIWVYYDWASGDKNPADGQSNTFNQLFPLGHKYFGFNDLVARENIQDLNFQFHLKPGEKSAFLIWWHIFHLDQAQDSLYNANGTAIRTSPGGVAGTNVGQEIDFTYKYTLSARADLLLGYSHFFAGRFVQATNPPGVAGNVDFTYTQFTWKF